MATEGYKKFQGGLGLAVAVVLAALAGDFMGYEPSAELVSAVAYILGYIFKISGLPKVED